jgi:hypothetical protein
MSKLDRTCSGALVALAMMAACGGTNREDEITATSGLSLVTLDDGGSETGATGGGDDGDDGPGADDGTGAASSDDGEPMMLDTKWDVHGGGSGGGPENSCMSDPLDDMDGDGFTEADGDCNDCDANVNPGAIEVEITEPDMMGNVPDPADEDCDGLIDNVAPPCDGAFALEDSNPFNAAAAMDLCKVATGPNDWGIVSASWVRANGGAGLGATPQFGILDNFGPNVAPQGGSQMLVLSSGRARLPSQANNCGSLTCGGTGVGTAPAGFPQDVPACPGSTAINDDIALEVVVRAPTNATGFSYNFDFYSFEYPEWVCTAYNDQYIALMNPPPVGAINGNISFDSQTNPVSVNIAFFDVCAGCALGTGELSQTGFDTWDDAGATSWLVTTAPVTGGQEYTLRFAIWDTGDNAWDSTVLIDGFEWIADGGTVTVGTQPEG